MWNRSTTTAAKRHNKGMAIKKKYTSVVKVTTTFTLFVDTDTDNDDKISSFACGYIKCVLGEFWLKQSKILAIYFDGVEVKEIDSKSNVISTQENK